MWKEIYIHESDIVWGISNKIVSYLATKVFYTFPSERIDNKKHILSGQILNPELIDKLGHEANYLISFFERAVDDKWHEEKTELFDKIITKIDELNSDYNISLDLNNICHR